MSSEVGEIEEMEQGKVEGEVSEELKELYYPRRNGWNCPWHPLQVLAWAFVVFFTLSYFGFLVFYIPGAWRSIGYIVAGVLFITHVSASLVTSIVDPAEVAVRERRSKRLGGGFLRAVFNRKKHARVIENHHCNLCDIKVSSSAKHCKVCEKCVAGFDHHCIWLNTCIGSRNYRWFMVTVFSALLACSLLLILTLGLFITFFSARDHIKYACSDHFFSANSSCNTSLRVFGTEVPDSVFPTLVAVIGLVSLVGVAMIGYLATFHVYLNVKGMTTYDYILLQRRREKERREKEAAQSESGEQSGAAVELERDLHGRCWCLRRKINRITPRGGVKEKGQGSQDRGFPGEEVAISMPASMDSAGLVNFGRTPVQSLHGSSMGDVSVMDSDSSSLQQLAIPADWAHGNTGGTRTGRPNEMQFVPNTANCSSAAAYIYDASATTAVERTAVNVGTGEDRYRLSSPLSAWESTRGPEKHANTPDIMCEGSGNGQDLENCGILAFMSSANTVTSSTMVCADSSLMKPDSSRATIQRGISEQAGSGYIENCGTLAFMSSANSITNIDVPAERQITCGDGGKHAASGVVYAANPSLVQSDLETEDEFSFYLPPARSDPTELKGSETGVGGRVALSTGSESTELQEKARDMLSRRPGNAVDMKALEREFTPSQRPLSSVGTGNSATTVARGFSNPLCVEESYSWLVGIGLPIIQGTLHPSHLARQSFPPPIQAPLTSWAPYQV